MELTDVYRNSYVVPLEKMYVLWTLRSSYDALATQALRFRASTGMLSMEH